MGEKSKISWTEDTWNPCTGCNKVSPGCKLCYAERMASRLQAMGQPNYRNGFQFTLHEHMLDIPLRKKRPRLYFVNSMSDLFHEQMPLEYLQRVFEVMVKATQHRFQILTKRAERLAELAPLLPWPENVWMGVSVENANYVGRIDHLRSVPAAVRFLSCEPLLGSLGELNLAGIHWVIAGGESQKGCRPMEDDWARDLLRQTHAAGAAFWMKQLGGHPYKRDKLEDFPEDLRVQEMPETTKVGGTVQ